MCGGYEHVKAVPAVFSAIAIMENQELSMPKMTVHTTAAPASAAYSQAVLGGGLVFVSGQESHESPRARWPMTSKLVVGGLRDR
jgi:enamine deaminase RidA (YjgF/YER057c/UK114 family)